jgi:drug/metabolite transporter (DMT)-like permease
VSLHLDRLTESALAARRMRFIAIALMISAMAFFAVLDTTAKYLSAYESPLQIAWLRYVFHALLVAIILNPWTAPGVWRSKRPGLQLLRSILLAATSVFNFSAVAYLQLDQVVTIAFLVPLLVAGLAGPILGEWVSRTSMLAILAGLLGVVLVTRPGFDDFHFAFLLALGNAVCMAVYSIATRFVTAYDSARTSIAITSVFGALALAPIMPFVWSWPENAWIWGLHFATGALGGFGHFLLILAHARAPAPVLAPFVYIELVFMILTGWLVFSDVPDIWTLAGAAVVISAGLFLLLHEKKPPTADIVD